MTDINEGDMVHEAIRQVLEETGLGFPDDGDGIDSAAICSCGF